MNHALWFPPATIEQHKRVKMGSFIFISSLMVVTNIAISKEWPANSGEKKAPYKQMKFP